LYYVQISYVFHCCDRLELDAAGVIDGVTLALQMALMYSLDVSIVHRREDTDGILIFFKYFIFIFSKNCRTDLSTVSSTILLMQG
jgi:hypothetical protein